MKHIALFLALLLASIKLVIAQTLTGNLKHHSGQIVTLIGFNYYETYELAKDTIDANGTFTLNYPKNYKGMAVLNTQDKNSLVLMLTEPTISLKGTHLSVIDSLQFVNSPKNQQFTKIATGYSQRMQAYKAWRYLQIKYKDHKPLSNQTKVLESIKQELIRIELENINAMKNTPKHSYLRWFLPIRKLVNDMPQTVHNYTERIPDNINQFRNIDFNNLNFKTSGLFKQLIEGHYMLIENIGEPLDTVYSEMNISTHNLIENLSGNDTLLNTVSEQLFNYFEKRSLYKASEYLAVTMLTKDQCSLNNDLANKFEAYRKLKAGNVAPNIKLDNNKYLSDYNTNTLLVFGASWCPTCKEEALKLLSFYDSWKAKELNVIYISIDTDKKAFERAYKNAPWLTYCDYKGWNTQAAKDYFITGTPSYFLLDKTQKILVRPSSLEQVDAWVNYKL